MISRFSLAFLTLFGTVLLAFGWALALLYTNPPMHPDNVDWPRALRDLILCLAAFLLFATAAYLPVRRAVAARLTAGFGLNFLGSWQILLNDMLRPQWWLADVIGLVAVPAGLALATLGLYQLGRMYRMSRLMLGSYQQIERDLATVDQLTQLYNRRYFFATCEPMFDRALARGERPTMIGLRVLNLTEINREHGLSAGDEVLSRAGRTIQRHTGPGSIAARMGGRRFAVLLPHGDQRQAQELAKQLSSRLQHLVIQDSRGREALVEVALDVRVEMASGPDDTLEALSRRVGSSVTCPTETAAPAPDNS